MADRENSELCSLAKRSLGALIADIADIAGDFSVDAFFIVILGDSNGETDRAPDWPAHA